MSWRSGGVSRAALSALDLSVAASRVYLGVHYPSDVASGLLMGRAVARIWPRWAARVTDFVLRVLPERVAVCRLAPDAPRPTWARGTLVSATRTPGELSVICDENAVPTDVRAERGWRALVLTGEHDLALVGVLKQVLDPLAEAGVSVFVDLDVRHGLRARPPVRRRGRGAAGRRARGDWASVAD